MKQTGVSEEKSGLIYSASRSGHNFKVEIELYGLKGVEKVYWKYKTKRFEAEKNDVFEIHNPSGGFMKKFKKVFKKYLGTEPEFLKRNLSSKQVKGSTLTWEVF